MSSTTNKRFVIFCFARTGSYLFTDILNKQEGVTCHEEIFKKHRVELDDTYLGQLGLTREDVDKRDAEPLEFMEAVYSASPGPVTGFKIFPSHNQKALTKLMYDPDVRKVFLARNPIQSYISSLVARASGSWTKIRKFKKEPDVQVEFVAEDMLQRITEHKKFFEHVLAVSKLIPENPFHFIDYSELKDRDRMQTLAEYLGIQSWKDDIASKYKKQIVRPYPEVVSNWDVVSNTCQQLGVDEKMTFYAFMKAYNSTLYSELRPESFNIRIKHALKRSIFN